MQYVDPQKNKWNYRGEAWSRKINCPELYPGNYTINLRRTYVDNSFIIARGIQDYWVEEVTCNNWIESEEIIQKWHLANDDKLLYDSWRLHIELSKMESRL